MIQITSTPPPALTRPPCPRCGTRMFLTRIFPDSPGYAQHTYECPRCEYEITEVIQYKKAG
jgi:ribosomal protein S27AE